MNDNEYSVYIVSCSDKSLYTGIAKSPEKRLEMHNSGKGAKFTRSRLPCQLEYQEGPYSKSDALKREWEIKQLSRKQKQSLIHQEK